jgi:hypothetical protein
MSRCQALTKMTSIFFWGLPETEAAPPARDFDRQAVEFHIRMAVMNDYTAL